VTYALTEAQQHLGQPERSLLLIDDDRSFADRARRGLGAAGYQVTVSNTGVDAERLLERLRPDVVVADGAAAGKVLHRLRSVLGEHAVPVILLVPEGQDVTAGLNLGADDCVSRPVDVAELVARVQAKESRPPMPAELMTRDPRTGLLSERTMLDEAERELNRGRSVGRPGALGMVQLQELPRLIQRFGPGTAVKLARQLADLLRADPLPLERLGLDRDGRLLVLLPEAPAEQVRARLTDLAAQIVATRFTLGEEERVRVTPVTGWVRFADAYDGHQLLLRAGTATEAASSHLDLIPVRWTPALRRVTRSAHQPRLRTRQLLNRLRLPAQILATLVLGIGLPLAGYELLGHFGLDVSTIAYWVVTAALLITAASIWVEGLHALDPQRPPDEPGADYPPATAIIAAYLPNEAATILDTVEAFQRVDYPGELQILVAYNTPKPMAVEDELRDLALLDPRVQPLKIEGSTSKAQNVNAAMSHVRGEFIGMFDADHHPDPRAFRRAWRWLSNGYDVVQGHCVIRNGDASLIARTVAVEFEAIYAVSHPGRSSLHGFGLFGGSNGYWRTELLARTRMRGSMLTEDIDSTLRVLSSGARIASDPALISRELAPTTLGSLWKQRVRWAQGWFQVSRKHLLATLRSDRLTTRQKVGMGFLLGWREIYPWLSLQMIPVIIYKATQAHSHLHWVVPSLLLASLFTITVGPSQTLFAHRLAVPELRARRRWFWLYLLVSSIAYTEWKNVIARVAQVKELFGEAQWNVTPRTPDAPARTEEAA